MLIIFSCKLPCFKKCFEDIYHVYRNQSSDLQWTGFCMSEESLHIFFEVITVASRKLDLFFYSMGKSRAYSRNLGQRSILTKKSTFHK